MTCETLQRFCKDSTEVLDYKVDWAAWLSSETISSSSWVIPTDITKDSDSFDPTFTTVWFSGGTIGDTYILTNTIATSAARTATRSFVITMGDR